MYNWFGQNVVVLSTHSVIALRVKTQSCANSLETPRRVYLCCCTGLASPLVFVWIRILAPALIDWPASHTLTKKIHHPGTRIHTLSPGQLRED